MSDLWLRTHDQQGRRVGGERGVLRGSQALAIDLDRHPPFGAEGEAGLVVPPHDARSGGRPVGAGQHARRRPDGGQWTQIA